MVHSGRLAHGGNPVLTWMAGNAVAETSATEEVKLVKKRKDRAEHKKIDGIITAVMIIGRAKGWKEETSCYETSSAM